MTVDARIEITAAVVIVAVVLALALGFDPTDLLGPGIPR